MKRGSTSAAACVLTAAAMALTSGVTARADTSDPPPGVPSFDFSECPELPGPSEDFSAICFNQVIVGGRVQIGGLAHEITDPIRFTFSDVTERKTGVRQNYAGPLHAKKVPVPSEDVGLPPGGTVYADPEYAGPIGLRYPNVTIGVKIRLTGAGLGGSCTIGADDDPILMNLTTGTTNPPPPNTPITGVPFKFLGSDGTVSVRSATHVDNAFPAPAARGCTRNGQNIDHAVNAAAGLPSPAGTNTVIIEEYFGYKLYDRLP
ncbi:MAG: hypothetical protein ACRDNL_05570 [Spirillospora sp.]